MKKIIFFIFAIITLSLSSCVEENVSYDESLELTFSCDTLVMDTLFAEQQSATGRFMIYNRNKNALNIESIRMAGGKDSFLMAKLFQELQRHSDFPFFVTYFSSFVLE